LQGSLDLLMVPGDIGTGVLLDDTSALASECVNWLRAMDSKVAIMASVCTGAAILAKCGFLDGVPARPTIRHLNGSRDGNL
jgi:putative intracellular protease/amidase